MRHDTLSRAGWTAQCVGHALGFYREVTTAILAQLPGIAWVGLGSAEVEVGTKEKRPPVWRALCERYRVMAKS